MRGSAALPPVCKVSCSFDDDQAEILERREHGAARPDHDPRPAGLNLVPLIVSFAFGQVAVQHCDHFLRLGKAALESLHGLGRKRDFRDEDNGRFSADEGRTDRLQINFRLPAPSHAVEQNGFCLLRCDQRFLNRAQGSRLPRIQGELRRRIGHPRVDRARPLPRERRTRFSSAQVWLSGEVWRRAHLTLKQSRRPGAAPCV